MTRMVGEVVGKRMREFSVGPDYLRPHHQTSVGIEVELEGVFHHMPAMKRWHVTDDGSLQNGIEFVSDPVWGTAITDALRELDVVLAPCDPITSRRCSVHVHINVLDMTTEQLVNMVHLYLMYEPALFRLHEGRENNIFCVPARHSLAIQQAYAELITHLTKRGLQINYVQSKYAAMNPNAVGGLGTLEFRHMAGTTNTNKISEWIDILLQLKVAALLDTERTIPSEVWGDQLGKLDIRAGDLSEGNRIIKRLDIWR